MFPIRCCALALAVFAPSLAFAAGTLTQQRQAEIQRVLSSATWNEVTGIRAGCASGGQPASIVRDRGFGLIELPDATDLCVTALTRIGRAGKLGYVRDTRTTTTTAALAFDNGFVTAYLKHEAVPANLPAMAMLKATAERCLDRREGDIDLCYSVGYAYGVRASSGEVVRVE